MLSFLCYLVSRIWCLAQCESRWPYGYRYIKFEVFSLIQLVCQRAFSLLASWCLKSWVRILHSATENMFTPFDSKIACFCQRIDINNNKYRFIATTHIANTGLRGAMHGTVLVMIITGFRRCLWNCTMKYGSYDIDLMISFINSGIQISLFLTHGGLVAQLSPQLNVRYQANAWTDVFRADCYHWVH